MILDVHLIKSVLVFHEEMIENGISLVYMGEFNQLITRMFTTMAEDDMERNNAKPKVRKRFYHIMVETLQNMSKHSDHIGDGSGAGNGLFMVGKKEPNYFVITSNKILNHRVEEIKDMIDELNDADADKLKEMYMRQIKEGSISDKGGAGLGLIDIRRKMGNKFQYQFVPIDDNYTLFLLKTAVSIEG